MKEMNVEAFRASRELTIYRGRSRGKSEREGDEQEPGEKGSFSIPMALTG